MANKSATECNAASDMHSGVPQWDWREMPQRWYCRAHKELPGGMCRNCFPRLVHLEWSYQSQSAEVICKERCSNCSWLWMVTHYKYWTDWGLVCKWPIAQNCLHMHLPSNCAKGDTNRWNRWRASVLLRPVLQINLERTPRYCHHGCKWDVSELVQTAMLTCLLALTRQDWTCVAHVTTNIRSAQSDQNTVWTHR